MFLILSVSSTAYYYRDDFNYNSVANLSNNNWSVHTILNTGGYIYAQTNGLDGWINRAMPQIQFYDVTWNATIITNRSSSSFYDYEKFSFGNNSAISGANQLINIFFDTAQDNGANESDLVLTTSSTYCFSGIIRCNGLYDRNTTGDIKTTINFNSVTKNLSVIRQDGCKVSTIINCNFSNYNITLFSGDSFSNINDFAIQDTSFFINFNYPQNNSVLSYIAVNNTNNFNGYINVSTNLYSNCSINGSFNLINSDGYNFVWFNNTLLNQQTLYINCSTSDFKYTNITYIFFIDNESPVLNNINLNSNEIPNSFFNLTFTAVDNNALWQITTFINNNILNETITNISIVNNIKEYNYSHIINLGQYGNYYYIFSVSDAHTKMDISQELNDMEIMPFNDDSQNETGKLYNLADTDLLISHPENITITDTYNIDSINYQFKTHGVYKNAYYELQSSYPIYYLSNSEFPCHFIINNLWHDCTGLKNSNVEIINDNDVIVHFDLNETANENSTGILNTAVYEGYFNIVPNLFNGNGTYTNVVINITNNIDVNNNLNLNVSVNNTLNLNNTLNINSTNNVNLSTENNFNVVVNITNPESSLNNETSMTNVYLVFIFLIAMYLILLYISLRLNTKIGLVLCFIVGVMLGIYLTSVLPSGFNLIGIGFSILNAYFIFAVISTNK